MATKPPLSPEEQTAKAKLRALAQGVRIWKLEGTEPPMYAVPSSSMDGTAYLLELHDNDDVTCTCAGNVYRNTCKHVGSLMLAMDYAAVKECLKPAISRSGASYTSTGQNPTARSPSVTITSSQNDSRL